MSPPSAPASCDELVPSPWVLRFAHLVGAGALVLDVACGSGRHARLFADRGCRVVAIDRNADAMVGLEGRAGIEPHLIDLEVAEPALPRGRFDLIVVTHYLHRPLFPLLITALADDGVLIYETFARGNEAFGRPSNPNFLLEPGELFRFAGGQLTVVAFEQGVVRTPSRSAVVQRLVAVGRERAWPPILDVG